MTPSQVITSLADRTATIVDGLGRRLMVRRLGALDTLRLFKAAGPVLAQNEAWLAMASLAIAVTEIDGVPVPAPGTEAQIESLVDRLGDAGLSAVAATMQGDPESEIGKAELGNLPGTLS